MAVIPVANFLDLADSIAAQSIELAKEMGTGIEAGTASLGAKTNYERIAALGVGEEDAMIDLLEAFEAQLDDVTTVPNAYNRFNRSLRALKRHVSGVAAYLTAQAERVAPEFKVAIEQESIETLEPENTFSPVVDPMGDLTITGANGANWNPGTDIDDTQYYAANLILEKTTAAGVADVIAITLTCTLWNGTAENKVVNVDASDAAGTLDDVGAHPADKYKSITLDSITCAAGSVGEAWKVISELERAVAL